MLINLRNALMAGKRLPYDAEVEYLECAGTSSVFPYIDTGIVGSMDVTVSARIWKSTKAMNECAMGSWDRGNTRCWLLYFNGNKYYLGMGPLSSTLTEVTSEVWHDIALTKSGNTFIYTADGTVVGQASSTSTFASTRTLYIGAMNDTGNPFYYFRGRFAFVKIYVAGVLVRDFIPVRKGTVGYLYDRVTRRLFGNAGTGDFVLGQDVVPVEYIESHGTEYIDVGPIVGADEVAVKLSASSIPSSGCYKAFGVGYTANFCDDFGINSSGWCGQSYAPVSLDTQSTAKMNQSGRFIDSKSLGGSSSPFFRKVAAGNRLFLFCGTNGSSAYIKESGSYMAWRGRFYSCVVSSLGNKMFDHLPVRVGTDATSWGGAMMDVLTRRIYRNAGTGAFGYGGDLKYPIPAE